MHYMESFLFVLTISMFDSYVFEVKITIPINLWREQCRIFDVILFSKGFENKKYYPNLAKPINERILNFE